MMRHSYRSTILERAYEKLSAAQIRKGMAPMIEAKRGAASNNEDNEDK